MRKLVVLVLVLLLSVFWLRPRRSESVGPSFVFPLSISGKVWATNVGLVTFVPRPAKVSDKILGVILRREDTSDFSAEFIDFLDADPAGRFFLYFDGRGADGSTTWRVGTNPNGVMTTTLNGAITQDGFCWLVGTYDVPVMGSIANAFVNGKVTFAKGTFNPVKISGTLNFVTNAAIGEAFTVKFKTVGKPTIV
jgi:hypothetical protein